ncbi:hypothetical protein SK128_014300 [Halocaridina rubra]|uniref:Uncharacterized protein n=1 Tax=Halocaridina rubra TaxID=373956 RepID=A0AAN8WW21_HALRR
MEKSLLADSTRPAASSPSSIRDIMANFASYATIDGISKILESRTKIRRTAWIIVCIMMSLCGAYECLMVTKEYLTYPKTVSISVSIVTTSGFAIPPVVEFPAITVCNLNPLPFKDELRDHKLWGAFIKIEEANSEPDDRFGLKLGIGRSYSKDEESDKRKKRDIEDASGSQTTPLEPSSADAKADTMAPKSLRENNSGQANYVTGDNSEDRRSKRNVDQERPSMTQSELALREKCSIYYKYLNYRNNAISLDEGLDITFIGNRDRITCPMSKLKSIGNMHLSEK